jgi:hypothetical protein
MLMLLQLATPSLPLSPSLTHTNTHTHTHTHTHQPSQRHAQGSSPTAAHHKGCPWLLVALGLCVCVCVCVSICTAARQQQQQKKISSSSCLIADDEVLLEGASFFFSSSSSSVHSHSRQNLLKHLATTMMLLLSCVCVCVGMCVRILSERKSNHEGRKKKCFAPSHTRHLNKHPNSRVIIRTAKVGNKNHNNYTIQPPRWRSPSSRRV